MWSATTCVVAMWSRATDTLKWLAGCDFTGDQPSHCEHGGVADIHHCCFVPQLIYRCTCYLPL